MTLKEEEQYEDCHKGRSYAVVLSVLRGVCIIEIGLLIASCPSQDGSDYIAC